MKILVPRLAMPQRLDKFLIQKFPQTNRAFWKEKLRANVRVEGCSVAPGLFLQGGEALEVWDEILARPSLRENSKIVLPILYEDEWILALDKPAPLPCYPLRAEENETVVNGLLSRLPEWETEFPDDFEKGLIHRLDNETSGVLLVAKTRAAKEKFKKLNQGGGIEKKYLAWVEGKVVSGRTITTPIAHHPKNTQKMIAVIDPNEERRLGARPALTRFEVLEQREGFSLLQVAIQKGQRHQIRVHLALIGYPIVGDKIYGRESPHSPRHLLHASQVELMHPFLKKPMEILAPRPEVFDFEF